MFLSHGTTRRAEDLLKDGPDPAESFSMAVATGLFFQGDPGAGLEESISTRPGLPRTIRDLP